MSVWKRCAAFNRVVLKDANDELLIIKTLRILLFGDGRWHILEILIQLILQVHNEIRRVMVNAEDSLL